jgi:hypothetical protein
MRFEHAEIDRLDPRTKDGLRLLLEHLCGDKSDIGCKSASESRHHACGRCQGCVNWEVLSRRLSQEALRTEDLNDILVLVDQSPVSEAFFKIFLSRGQNEISFDDLKKGVANFEGHAVLLFGNVRFAYRRLRQLTESQIRREMRGLDRLTSVVLKEEFEDRRDALPLPSEVNKSSTWLLGYIARNKVDRDLMMSVAMAAALGREKEQDFLKGKNETQRTLYGQLKERLNTNKLWREIYADFDCVEEKINAIQLEIQESRKAGCLNTSHYLALDYMDVYVATSMRERWEFEDVHATSGEIFRHAALENLKLRYFDPTQSYLDNRIDKGLVEALMLKRARCTIYMAQETDTFGKDSELAATLAQGKPVIVFVPEINVDEHARLAEQRPIAYVQRRLCQLLSEDRIRQEDVKSVLDFLQKTATFDPFFQVIGDEEEKFVAGNKLGDSKRGMCGVLSAAEKGLFDGRARALQRSHPLGLQVHLETGVANGVLVVRSVQHCAELLEKLMTNGCEFTFDDQRELGIKCLVEKISNSPFRVVTENVTVSNAFWSRYLSGTDRLKPQQ